MSEVVIKAENLSKQYRLGQVGTGSLKDDFKRWQYRIRGKDDPFLMVGEENDRSKKSTNDYVWALKDIDFEVKQGDVLGIIGKNGAGKSTLLKILSRTTGPTTGSLKMKGRVASLLEVGTGFHGELSGRENIFLNGAIMGMSKIEIKKKFDEIVDFAGVERYIDTPVKRYSSGMYVRLAFGVAAHLEPDIMIVDEVLAVGDVEFQKKALGKMNDVSKNEGRTVLFVSHNIQAVKQLCQRGIIMNNGKIELDSDISSCVTKYLSGHGTNQVILKDGEGSGDNHSYISSISIKVNGELTTLAGIEKEVSVEIEYFNKKDNRILNLSVAVFDEQGNYAFSSPSNDPFFSMKPHKKGLYKSILTIPEHIFNNGSYFFSILLVENGRNIVVQLDNVVQIEMHANNIDTMGYFGYWGGVLRPKMNWGTVKIQ
jgi:lipopolysaccharide transport system ATP-binding protein